MNAPSPAVVRDLQTALHWLRTGQPQAARQLLARLIDSDPSLVDAHWMMSGLHFQSGNLEAARQSVEATLALAPDHAAAHALRGEIQARAGASVAAEGSLRRALTLAPGHLQAAISLGYLLLAQERFAEVLELVETTGRPSHADPGLLMLKGQALLGLQRMQDAVATFEHLLKLAPDSVEAAVALAAALADNGDPGQAEKIVRARIRRGQGIPEAHFVLGRSLLAQNRIEEAGEELRRAVHARPDYIAAQVNLSELVWMQTSNPDTASVELDAALRLHPDLADLRIAKANMLEAAQMPERAMAELEDGLAKCGERFDLCFALAQIAIKHDAERAAEYARRALGFAPENQAALLVFSGALLGIGQAEEAERIASRLRRMAPDDCQVLAFQATAWRLLGDPRYTELYDYRRARPQLIDTPRGWPTLQAYLADVNKSLQRLHAFQTHPVAQSLRLGSQTDLDLDNAKDPVLRAFAEAIDGPIRRYMAALDGEMSEFAQRNTGSYRLNGIWSVRLKPNGYHVDHVHPKGWLSSACYIALPSSVERDGRQGWIQFGKPGIKTRPELDAEHFIKPEPGLLALFPSFMWHGTVPFQGPPDTSRLTIAFDVIPA